MIESFDRNEVRRRRQKIIDDFIIAEVTAANILIPFSGKSKPLPKPWDYYTKLFEEEQEAFEEQDRKQKLEEYKENRKRYVAEHNRRRQQGLI